MVYSDEHGVRMEAWVCSVVWALSRAPQAIRIDAVGKGATVRLATCPFVRCATQGTSRERPRSKVVQVGVQAVERIGDAIGLSEPIAEVE
jgi:hypothetical protein